MSDIEKTPTNLDTVLEMLQAMTEIAATTPEEIEASILARYLAAESVEELLNQGATVPADSVIGQPITIRGVHWNASTVKDGPPVYAVLDCTDAGKPVTVTCGSRNVMFQVFRADQAGWLPMDCVIDKIAVPTANGFYPMQLRPVFPSDEALVEARTRRPKRGVVTEAAGDDEPF